MRASGNGSNELGGAGSSLELSAARQIDIKLVGFTRFQTMNRLVFAVFALALGSSMKARAQERMPPIPPENMTNAQKKAAQDYKDLRSQTLGGGPWGVILRVPDLMVPSVQFRIHNQKNSAQSPKLTKFAILIAARHWTNNYEFV